MRGKSATRPLSAAFELMLALVLLLVAFFSFPLFLSSLALNFFFFFD